VATVVDDDGDDGDIEWLGSQPKKQRSPAEGEEVMDVEDSASRCDTLSLRRWIGRSHERKSVAVVNSTS
jgi:hypothetical protein